MEENSMTEDYTPILEQICALPCRCCMQHTLRAWAQRAYLPGGRDLIQVDCTNAACALYAVTLTFKEWIKFDLSVWRTTEHPAWHDAIVEQATATSSLSALVESHIREHDAPLADVVLRDFREQLRDALPYRRRDVALSWLHIYTWSL